MNWYTAAQVSVNNNSTIVRVGSGESIAAINPHDSLVIGDFTGVDILKTYVEDGTNDEIIELVLPWAEVNQVNQPAKVIPTAVNFNSSVTVLSETNANILSRLNEYILFGEQASGDVTFTTIGVGHSDVTTHCIAEWDSIFTTLEQQGQGAVDDLAAVDSAINTPTTGLAAKVLKAQTDLSNLSGTMTGYINTASGHSDDAWDYREQSRVYSEATDDLKTDVTNLKTDVTGLKSDVTGMHGEVDTWHGQTEGFKNSAYTDKELAKNYMDLAEMYAKHPHNVVIPNTDGHYSALHYKEETVGLSEGDAPNAQKLGNQLPAYYATAQSVTDLSNISYKKGADIGATANLDGYTSTGFYHQNNNAYASAGTNYPTGLAGMLEVTADGSMVYQTYRTYNDSGVWYRSKYISAWQPWRRIYSTRDGMLGAGSLAATNRWTGANTFVNSGASLKTSSHGLISAVSEAGTTGGWARAAKWMSGLNSLNTKSFEVGGYGVGDAIAYGFLTANGGAAIGSEYDDANALRIYPTYPAWGTNKIYHEGYKPSASSLGAVATATSRQELNLNDLTGETKFYKIGGGVTTNLPSGSNGFGSLLNANNFDTNQQIYFGHGSYSTGSVYFRSDGNNGMNAPWLEFYHEGHKPEISEVNELQAKLDEIELFALAGLL